MTQFCKILDRLNFFIVPPLYRSEHPMALNKLPPGGWGRRWGTTPSHRAEEQPVKVQGQRRGPRSSAPVASLSPQVNEGFAPLLIETISHLDLSRSLLQFTSGLPQLCVAFMAG
eukprot:scaffold5551_cov159-Ochromonas_danica.AAC.2